MGACNTKQEDELPITEPEISNPRNMFEEVTRQDRRERIIGEEADRNEEQPPESTNKEREETETKVTSEEEAERQLEECMDIVCGWCIMPCLLSIICSDN